MDDRETQELLETLETRPDARIRERVCCDECGSKDHVKLVVIPPKEKGGKSEKLYLCVRHRPKNPYKSERKNSHDSRANKRADKSSP